MHKVRFYPLGNADTTLIMLDNEKAILFDYADMLDREDKYDKRIDLPSELEQAVDGDFEVVAFTHADQDHINKFSEFFFLEHADKYQSDDRKKIKTLWVPASIILEPNLKDEAAILRAEARHRLKKGKGIRVFSKPEKLEEWLKSEGLSLKDRESCITGAGKIAPEFSLEEDGVEFFVHAPFVDSIDEQAYDRNNAGLVMQATFTSEDETTRLILGADVDYDIWNEIVKITKYYKRTERLNWDIFKISHHCSYLALNEDKGKDKTEPTDNVKWLFRQGNEKGYLVATCKPIPNNDDDKQPPHWQAANYYHDVEKDIKGSFIVTMEYPNKNQPKPVVIKIDSSKATHEKKNAAAVTVLTQKSSPRAG